MRYITAILLSLATATLASPATRAFQIIIETPNFETFAPMYLTSNGTATSINSDAATCHITSGELFCGSDVPIGTGNSAGDALLVGLQGKDSINTQWSITDARLHWVSRRFPNVKGGNVTFKYELDDGTLPAGGVYAVLGGDEITDLERLSTPARLLQHIPNNW